MTDRCSCNHLASQHDGVCRECRCPEWTDDWSPVPALINERTDWPLLLPPYRAYRSSWATHEAARLAAMHDVISGLYESLVFEVGAEEGDYGALFTSWGARVVLVEPNPMVWPSIKASFEANGFQPHAWWQGFLADRSDSVPPSEGFGFGGSWPAAADGPLIAEHGFQHLDEHYATPRLTLDALTGLAGAPDVVSIDVEGSELHVLRGATETLELFRPVVFVSIHPQFMADRYAHTPEMLFDLMDAAGYDRTYLATDHEEHYRFTPKERA